MGRGQIVVALSLALASSACRGPTPSPTPLQLDRVADKQAEDSPSPTVPKFDVAPPGPTAKPRHGTLPPGFVDVANVDATIRIDMRYATADNFTGAPLPGYLPGNAWLLADAAEALAQVQRDLQVDGLGLLVFDAYRPVRATRAMVRWAEKTGRTQLLDDGYVARVSNHNRGHTVDLTLVQLADGKQLEMGTAWDTFSEASHYASATGPAMKNRKRLRLAMKKRGFVPYEKEWWHFTYPVEPEPAARDASYAAQ